VETADGAEELEGDPMQVALEGVLGYLERTVLPALEEARSLSEPGAALQDAVDALEDLAFYAGSREEEPASRENLAQLVQAVTREYTLETGIPLRVKGPDRPIHFHTRPEALKDTLFLLLANAGRWGEGKTVDLTLAAEEGRVRVTVMDRGPGFSSEALNRAFQPFWSSERDALGLGLTHARHLARGMGGDLMLRNREEGGGEVVLDLPQGQGPSPSE
jgi:signal transduction histidine kinase